MGIMIRITTTWFNSTYGNQSKFPFARMVFHIQSENIPLQGLSLRAISTENRCVREDLLKFPISFPPLDLKADTQTNWLQRK